MAKKILIVESPGKVKKISGFLGSDWQVLASVGHIRDMPDRGPEKFVYPPDYKASYVPTEGKVEVIQRLARAVKQVESVYLATDPDREGEAIAWHLKEALNLPDDVARVTYTEITEKAVKEAVAHPRRIDMALVWAQECRRVVDRHFGFKPTNAVQTALGLFMPQGRVQSPAVRLVVEREKAIRDFRPTTHFGVELSFNCAEGASNGWKAFWNTKNWLEDGQEYVLDKALAERIAEIRQVLIAKYEEGEAKQSPPAPFTTSTIQQAASNALKFNPKRTMDLAQKLYEGGHITYMRTDSPNLSAEAIADIRSLASRNDWPVPPRPRTWKSKEGAQEAHEAIRPTHFEVETAGDNTDERALYNLIRVRALASQLEDARYATTKVVLEAKLDGKKVIFEAKGRRLISPGWRAILDGDATEEPNKEEEMANPIPRLGEGGEAVANKGEVKTKKTSPPGRFTQAALIKDLEKRGIGRPSTYASIMEKIISQKYCLENRKRQLEATELGEKLIANLLGHFSHADFNFTQKLEARLDDIAEGQADYLTVVKESFSVLDGEMAIYAQKNGLACPVCGQPLAHLAKPDSKDKKGYNFWACSNRSCEARFKDNQGKPGDKQDVAQVSSEFKCPDCGRALVRHDGQFGVWWGCSGWKDGCPVKFDDADGRPGVKKTPPKPGVPTKEKCPKCQALLTRFEGVSAKSGKPWARYRCKCGASYWEGHDGRPNCGRESVEVESLA